MKKVKGFNMRSLCRENIILPENGSPVNFNKMIALNSSAAFLWKSVGNDEFSVDTLKELLISEYEVDEQTAMTDAGNIARSWIEVGIVSE
ncbi:MAG: PqqD family protein [Bacteroidaceae bacterium]|nr:PqqD family protein [Bacteroidaceae bacterium]